MRIDAHHHLWGLGWPGQGWLHEPGREHLVRSFLPNDLDEVAAGSGIASSVLVQVLTRVDETRKLLALARVSDRIAAVVGWVDLTEPDVTDRLAELRAAPGGAGLVGIRHHQTFTDNDLSRWLARSDSRNGLQVLSEWGLSFDLLAHASELVAAARVASEYPDLTFVLNHMGRPFAPGADRFLWAEGIYALAAQPNVYCKLSGLVNLHVPIDQLMDEVPPYVAHVLTAFGASRVLFGSDWPMWFGRYTYQQVVDLAAATLDSISESDRAEVLGGSARRAYRLS